MAAVIGKPRGGGAEGLKVPTQGFSWRTSVVLATLVSRGDARERKEAAPSRK